jgi:hypothetical protein
MLVLGVWLAAAGANAPPVPRAATVIAQIRVQRTSIVRIQPVTPDIVTAEPVKWKEKGGPDCIKWSTIAGAMISSRNSLDVILRGGKRYRVKLSKRCQAGEFYSDFYVKTTVDGQLCQSRDSIYSRAGGECGIDKFRSLTRAK